MNDRYAIRVEGRGLVTTFNDEPIVGREEADRIAGIVREALMEKCSVEKLLLEIPVAAPPEKETHG